MLANASRVALILATLLVATAVLVPFWYWTGGLIEVETLEFIQRYRSGGDVLRKVFDPYANDLGTYQARELSYFFDYLDARVFGVLIARGQVVLVPATAFLSSSLTIVIFWRSVRRYRAIPARTAALVLLLYFSNYVYLVTMGMFYRSSKPLLAPLAMGMTYYLLSLVRANDVTNARAPSTAWAPLVVFSTLCLMGLLDRQGFFFALIAAAVLVCDAALAGGRRYVAGASIGAIVALGAYNAILAPAIVQALNGYTPSLEYQRATWDLLWANPGHMARAVELLGYSSGMLLGGVPYWLALAVLGVLLAWSARRRTALAGASEARADPHDGRRWTRPRVVLVCAVVALAHVFMFAAMIARHPPIYESDHRMWYYPLPFQAVLVALLVVLLNRIASTATRWHVTAINIALIVGVLANTAQWGRDFRHQQGSRWFSMVYTQSYLLKLSLDEGRPYTMQPAYLAFYRYCLSLSPELRAQADKTGDRE